MKTNTPTTHTMNPLANPVFIPIFGREDSVELTTSLVNAVLRAAELPEVTGDVRIEGEATLVSQNADGKWPRLDVKLIGPYDAIDLEAELHYADSIVDRALYYASKLLASELSRGDDYIQLARTTVIALYDVKELFPETVDFVHVARLRWDDVDGDGVATDKLNLVVVELQKFRKRYTSLTQQVLSDELLSWLYLLTEGYKQSDEVAMIAEYQQRIAEFARKYGLAENDPSTIAKYEAWDSAERSYNGSMRYAREEGRAEGEARGTANTILRMAALTETPAEELLAKMQLPPEEHAAVLAAMNTLRAE